MLAPRARRSSTRCALGSARSRSGCTRSTTLPPPTSPPPSMALRTPAHISLPPRRIALTPRWCSADSPKARPSWASSPPTLYPMGFPLRTCPRQCRPTRPTTSRRLPCSENRHRASCTRSMTRQSSSALSMSPRPSTSASTMTLSAILREEFSAHNQYIESGMVDQGATFVVNQLQASWAAEVPVPPPAAAPPPLVPSAPLPLTAPVAPVAPSALPAGRADPSAHLPSAPLTPPGPAGPVAPSPPVGPLA